MVRPGLALLVRSLEPSPAVLLSRRLDLLAYNETAEQLLGPFEAERNYARIVLLDPRSRALHADWDEAARQTVALLRFAAARHPQDAALHALAAELRAASDSVGASGGRAATSPRSATASSVTGTLRVVTWRSASRRCCSPTTATRS